MLYIRYTSCVWFIVQVITVLYIFSPLSPFEDRSSSTLKLDGNHSHWRVWLCGCVNEVSEVLEKEGDI